MVQSKSLAACIHVDAESRVKVRYPWFRVFFTKSVSAEDIRAEVKKELGSVKQTMQTQVRETGASTGKLANIDL